MNFTSVRVRDPGRSCLKAPGRTLCEATGSRILSQPMTGRDGQLDFVGSSVPECAIRLLGAPR